MWVFLNQKYGSDFEVRRHYYKEHFAFTTKLEIRFKRVPILPVYSERLAKGEVPLLQFVQIRNSHTYSDLKKRISECLGTKLEAIRLW